MKIKFKKAAILLTCLAFLVLTGCKHSQFIENPSLELRESFNGHIFQYTSNLKDSLLKFQVELSPQNDKGALMQQEFIIDLHRLKLKGVGAYIADKVSSEKGKYKKTQLLAMCEVVRSAIDKQFSKDPDIMMKKRELQGLYITLSYLRSLLRQGDALSPARAQYYKASAAKMSSRPVLLPQYSDQPAYASQVFEGFELGLSPFILNDDIIINKALFIQMVDDDMAAAVNDDQGLYVFKAVANSIPYSNFSHSDFLVALDEYVKLHPQNFSGSNGCKVGWWPSGSSHGCCGNYSGCCYYWHEVCYIHDKLCAKCNHWWCFSGCVPDKSPRPSPFTLLEESVQPGQLGGTLPLPLPASIDYKISFSEISQFTPYSWTSIYFDTASSKYYVDSGKTQLVPDGYYDSPTERNGHQHVYYEIQNGVIIETFVVTNSFD